MEPVSEAAVAADRPAPAPSTGRRAACGRLAPPCRAGCDPAPHGSWLRGLKPREAESRRSPRGREGKGRKGAAGRLPAPHPALPWSSHLPGLSQLCPPCVEPGTGTGDGAEPPDPWAGLGARGRAKGRQCWRWEQPFASLSGAGPSCPPRRNGVCHRWVTATLGRGAPARRGAAGSIRTWISGKRSAQCTGKQRLVYLPNKPGEGGTGPTAPPPCSDARLGTASPRQPQTHVGAHGCLAPAPLPAPGEAPCRPGVPSPLPPAAVGCRGAGRVRRSW